MNFCTIFLGFVIIGNYSVIGSDYGINDPTYLTLVGSIGSVAGSLRFLWSCQLDFGLRYPTVYGMLMIVQLACSLSVLPAAANQIQPLFMAAVALTFWCEGGHFVLLPAHCADVFGSPERGVVAFSYLFSCFGLSSIAGSIVLEILLKIQNDNEDFDAYNYLMKAASALTVVAFLVLFCYSAILDKMRRQEEQK